MWSLEVVVPKGWTECTQVFTLSINEWGRGQSERIQSEENAEKVQRSWTTELPYL